MKRNLLLTALIFLVSLYTAHSQDSLEIQKLRHQIVTRTLIQKSKSVVDPELRALLAKQALNFAKRYDLTDELWGELYSLSYYGLQGLNRSAFYQNDRQITLPEAQRKVDSAYNQYLVHNPTAKVVVVRSIHITKDGTGMYTAGGDGKILKWDISSRDYEVLYQNNKVNRVVDLSPDERWLAIATNDEEIGLFELLAPQKGIKNIKAHNGSTVDLDFFNDGSGFVTVGADRLVLSNDFKKSKLITKIGFTANSLDISPNGKTIAIGSMRGDVALIDLTQNDNNVYNIYRNKLESKPVEVVQFSNNGKYLVFGGYDRETGHGYAYVWNNEKKEEHGPRLTGFTAGVTSIAFSQDDKLLAVGSKDNTVRIWNMDEDLIYNHPIVLDDHKDWVWSVDFHSDNKRIFTASADGIIRVFDLALSSFDNAFCPLLTRNLTPIEWRTFIGKVEDYPREATCPDIEE